MTDDDSSRINLGYPLAQLLKAQSSVSERAPTRIRQWQQVIAGLLGGSLKVGARTPVQDAPAWVTLEVVTGGFATGNLAADGPLLVHEAEKLKSVVRPGQATDRTSLNLHYVSDQGADELTAMLGSGCFRVAVPEEGALLIAAWLSANAERERSAGLIETVMPFFDRLRFYPVPHDRPLRVGTGVHLQAAGDTAKVLRAKRPQMAVATMNESIQIWTPLYDRAVALMLETVDGEPPRFDRAASGQLLRASNGQPIVAGGWPCRHYPAEWADRAKALLTDYAVARATHTLSAKPERSKENFARLRAIIATCARDPHSLTGREVGLARKVLASYVAKYGTPGTRRLHDVRAAQALNAALPLHHVVARVVAERLAGYPPEEGVSDIAQLTGAISDAESRASGIPSGEGLPRAVAFKSVRCLEAPLEELVQRQILPSSESMAMLLPTVTSHARAAAISDPELRRVYEAVYVAFRRRRSLLLLDLASQVRLEELPWVAAVEPWVGSDDASRQAALETLVRATSLALETYPQTIFPNKLVKEFQALVRSAGLQIPLVEELAADIFMGAFSEKFLLAGKAAALLLQGTLYERYYGIPYSSILQFDDVVRPERGAPTSPAFGALCRSLARSVDGERWSVARNGTVIEQAEIITTHNLASLLNVAGVRIVIEPRLSAMAQQSFRWICRRLQVRTSNWRAQLQSTKNAAYAWRQILFYLALAGEDETRTFGSWSLEYLDRQDAAFRERFTPVVSGLIAVIDGEVFGVDGLHAPTGGRRFLGWSVGRHWLLGERAEDDVSR